MKTFFNVLYRRILYKIPFKWLLVLLVVLAIGVASFSSASFDCFPLYGGQAKNVSQVGMYWDFVSGSDTYCIVASEGTIRYDFNCGGNRATLTQGQAHCVSKTEYPTNGHQVCVSPSTINDLIGIVYFPSNCLSQSYTSLQCQTEYNLIPISSVDSNYCTTNNLCPNCPSCPVCPSGGSGRSNVYINDILHVGAPNIIMNISEEIDRDYAYTQGGNNMNIDVVGYNVDYEKMQEIIDLQNYKPTDEDFSSLVGMLAPYIKIIIFFVFLFIIWAWIKKPFKSKKL